MREPPSAGARPRAGRSNLLGFFLAVAIGLIAAAPLWSAPYFRSDDGLTHLWRVWEYARAAQDVGPFVRWAPDAAYGFGAPVFTFYNPLSYMLGALAVGVVGTAAAATKLVFAGALVASAVGAYLLGRAWAVHAPTPAGIVAALLYTLVAYRLATVYQRGALAEVLGLAIAPLVVLFALRTVDRGQADMGPPHGARDVAGLAVATGAVVLAHTIAALFTLPFAGLIGLARLVESRPAARRAGLARLCLGFGLGIALAALYWLPAVGQQSTVQLERARWSGAETTFTAGFVWPWETIQLSPLHVYGREVDGAAPAVGSTPGIGGFAAVALGLGALYGLVTGRLRRPTGLVALATVAVAFALAAPPAARLWEEVPLLGAIQLGWRLLGLVLLAAIPLAAGLVDLPLAEERRPGLLLAAVAAVTALWRLPVQELPWSAANERPIELPAYERKAGQFALGALREYVPRWSLLTPDELAHAARLDPSPPAAIPEVQLVRASGAERVYRVETPAATSLVLDLFYHPALSATVDGRNAALRPEGPAGLAAIDLPEGVHELVVGPGPTPLERAGGALSAVALILVVALTAAPGAALRLVRETPGSVRRLTGRRAAAAAAAGLALAGVGLGLPRVVLGSSVPSAPAIAAPLGDGARVLGVVADDSLVEDLGLVTLDVHLHALRAFPDSPPMTVALVDAEGRRIAAARGAPGSGFRPASRWQPNELLVARTELRLPDAAPAGQYAVEVELNGAVARSSPVALPTVGSARMVGAPLARHETVFGDGLVLDGYVYDRRPDGGAFPASFWWRRTTEFASAEYDATLSFVDKHGNPLARQTRRFGGAGSMRPTAEFVLDLPDPLPAESYRLELQVRVADGPELPARSFGGSPSGRLVLEWFDVRDPCNCVAPDATRHVHVFRDGIALLGWRIDRIDNEVLDLSLWWTGVGRPSRDYTIFVHAMSGDRRVAQIDDQPNGGRRPTGQWLPGAVVHDRYRLRIPSGAVDAVKVGLYGPPNGERLPLEPPTPENAVVIPVRAAR